MKSIYVVSFENQMEVMTQEGFENFLKIPVINNKDITSFSVLDISRQPVPIELVSKVVGLAYLQCNINLLGGQLTDNFTKMYLYEN